MQINDLDGQEFNGDILYILPKEVLEFNIEIAMNHPKLQAVLAQTLTEDNYSPEIYFGQIAAYCGIVLDSSTSIGGYSVSELYDQLGRALINKRETMAVGVNTIPSVQALIGLVQEMKEANETAIAPKELII